MHQYNIIGLMSGTSLDGLDIAYCQFIKQSDVWKYQIIKAETIPYSKYWRQKLSSLLTASALEITETDFSYGKYLGKCTKKFIEKHKLKPNFIASHGHTVFHDPDIGYTQQIGKGEAIFSATSIPTIYDFRTLDVVLGGQGAPLVPIGDLKLFSDYEYCLNLGGIANISEKKSNSIVAYDICPCNLVLNYLASQNGLSYDQNGTLAKTGQVNLPLLEKLNQLPFYH